MVPTHKLKKNMNILVTGGLGFIGYNLVKKLNQSENKIVVIDNLISESSNELNKVEGVKYIIDDINNLNDIFFAEEFDIIYHLAGLARIQPSFKNPIHYMKANVMGTTNVCEFARKNNSKVVYAGSSSAFGGHLLNPYTFSKYQGEEICKMYSEIYGLSTVISRFFNVYGDRQPVKGEYATLIGIYENLYIQNKPLKITGDGEQRRDFTHINDICSGLMKLSEQPYKGEIFSIGNGKNYSINDIASMFGSDKIYIPSRKGETKITLADNTKLMELGWEPKGDIAEYIKEFIISVEK